VKLSGFTAWAAWLGIHIFFLIGFRNRFVVLMEWAIAYITHQRNARLILEPPHAAGIAAPAAPAELSARDDRRR
jgi:NADH:ubiquinone reductase (H+-translocating)